MPAPVGEDAVYEGAGEAERAAVVEGGFELSRREVRARLGPRRLEQALDYRGSLGLAGATVDRVLSDWRRQRVKSTRRLSSRG